VSQRALVDGDLAGGDSVDLGADLQHRVAEPVELGERFALGGLDHQGAGHREAHRGSVEAVVDEPLGDVVDRHPRRLGDLPRSMMHSWATRPCAPV
jgi:hypothetical protein